MFNGGSPPAHGHGGSLARAQIVAAQPRAGRRAFLPRSSAAPKSPGSCRVYLAKGSPAAQTRGGGSSHAKFPSPRGAQMNNGDTSVIDPDVVARAPTAMGSISTGEIKLLEEFVTFCMSKRVSSRGDGWNNRGSIGDHCLKRKLFDCFGHVLHEQAINAIFDVVHGSNQRMCNLCKSSSQDLVMSVLEIACQSMIKKHEDFSREANMMSSDGKHPLNVGERIEPKQPNPTILAKEQVYQSDQINCVGKESTVMEIGELRKANLPPVDTPAIKKAFVNPGFTGNSNPGPALVCLSGTIESTGSCALPYALPYLLHLKVHWRGGGFSTPHLLKIQFVHQGPLQLCKFTVGNAVHIASEVLIKEEYNVKRMAVPLLTKKIVIKRVKCIMCCFHFATGQ